VSNTGVVSRPSHASGDASVTLTATMNNGTITQTKQFVLTVSKLAQTTTEAVTEVNTWLTWDQIKGSNTSQTAVTVNLNLLTTRTSTGNLSVAIAWASNSTGVISTAGVVVRPSGTTDKVVVLTATISSSTITQTKTFSITVTKLTMIAAVPTQSNTLTYSGSSQSPTWNTTVNMTATGGTASSVNAGNFTRAFTPNTGYQWWDGKVGAKNANWSIAKQIPLSTAWSINPTSISLNSTSTTYHATVNVNKGSLNRDIKASTSSNGYAQAQAQFDSVLFTRGSSAVTSGTSATGYICIAGNDNYADTANKTVNITVYGQGWSK